MPNDLPEILFQDIGDSSIQYLHYRGNGPKIVMLHATGFSPWLWHPIARELSGQFEIIAPYFCDHRETDPEKGGLNWLQLAEDLYRLYEALNIGRSFLVGHSMGATVITLANALNSHIGEKMILIEPIFLPDDFYTTQITVDEHPLASKSIKRRNRWESREEIKQDYIANSFFQPWDDEMLDLYIKHGMTEIDDGGLELTCSPLREASLFMGGLKYDPWPFVEKVTCPVLVVEGEFSENRNLIDLKKIADTFPDGSYHMVEDAGHLIPMEKPGDILALIKSFLMAS
ncbi:MAG: alpha/beta hydrolase [Desulfobacterales bacterium]|jgi:lipase|nr:alpha/beta hydrolase [Desulfobacteraceae bacterium]MBT7087292.1 alpha/beta hydrolase [Desulfobacterales bacterium]MBT7698162.1 alpha/beta hydrolase [Desulfobacterales bacterium]